MRRLRFGPRQQITPQKISLEGASAARIKNPAELFCGFRLGILGSLKSFLRKSELIAHAWANCGSGLRSPRCSVFYVCRFGRSLTLELRQTVVVFCNSNRLGKFPGSARLKNVALTANDEAAELGQRGNIFQFETGPVRPCNGNPPMARKSLLLKRLQELWDLIGLDDALFRASFGGHEHGFA
jgi:hypothetical protein